MQKIFYVQAEQTNVNIFSSLQDIHDFIGKNGKIISVTANTVSTSGNIEKKIYGGWLIVAENDERT